FAPGNYP
nr:Chain E, PHE-ALA-PRO-GLY-ASN-TYR-PRO [Respirovirus muris]6GB5_F Chain F, PHE-ALA-PRO-GLY-ASN-TYR-PRO [Respirovirus muris]6GB7_I Chain I, PHE-ALA-PRO-GLY-ASN-TYR-PRO [Respirovirus muris]6GB7_J Chain J, PHE-ALA-PRO-GLY-ASN-TYR-PRO [Respirovirus muris]6GB7_K Chain K, PHE-ALA-PRO-GLY-ASN-TYR-PRO [Respirovirus muris]6GB7_L Chain L, PHE-ALA-PRO-GLY-ASN-TYR-PRO [Respirovirus muris]